MKWVSDGCDFLGGKLKDFGRTTRKARKAVGGIQWSGNLPWDFTFWYGPLFFTPRISKQMTVEYCNILQ